MFEFRHPDRAPARQRVVAAHRQDELFDHQLPGLHPGPVHGEDHDGQVHLALLQPVDQLAGPGFVDRQVEPRVAGVERRQHRRQQVRRQAGRGSEDQAAPFQAEQVPHRGRAGLAVGQHLPGPGQEHFARPRQGHLVAIPVEEGGAELVLEGGHGAAHRRLGHVEPGRRPREPLLLGDTDHVAKLVQLHAHSLCL